MQEITFQLGTRTVEATQENGHSCQATHRFTHYGDRYLYALRQRLGGPVSGSVDDSVVDHWVMPSVSSMGWETAIYARFSVSANPSDGPVFRETVNTAESLLLAG